MNEAHEFSLISRFRSLGWCCSLWRLWMQNGRKTFPDFWTVAEAETAQTKFLLEFRDALNSRCIEEWTTSLWKTSTWVLLIEPNFKANNLKIEAFLNVFHYAPISKLRICFISKSIDLFLPKKRERHGECLYFATDWVNCVSVALPCRLKIFAPDQITLKLYHVLINCNSISHSAIEFLRFIDLKMARKMFILAYWNSIFNMPWSWYFSSPLHMGL